MDSKAIEQIQQYIAKLIKYNKSINLIGSIDEENYYNSFHIQTCLDLIRLLDKSTESKEQCKIYDLGSGNGLPGIIFAICGYNNVFLYEIDKRKAAFLEIINSKFKLNMKISGDYCSASSYDGIIITKAMDSIFNVVKNLYDKISPKTKFFFMKGKNFREDIDLALKYYNFDFMIHKSDKFDSYIIEIENIKKHD